MRDGIPAGDRTMVVVPAIVDSEARLLSLLDELEVRFFANRDAHLHFALLTDFTRCRHEPPRRRTSRSSTPHEAASTG